MRYYAIKFKATSETIKEHSKIELREYGYNGILESVNSYVYSHMQNDVTFLIYREEKNLILAIFSYNERKVSFQTASDNLLCLLKDTFGINRVQKELEELTMCEFFDCLQEAKRRDIVYGAGKIVEESNLCFYNYYCNGINNISYDFQECIVPKKENPIPMSLS